MYEIIVLFTLWRDNMEVLKTRKVIDLLKALLLSVTIFLFLFYVAWSIPITILAKAFNIMDYFIKDNFFVLLSLGIALLLFLLQILFIFCNTKIYTKIVSGSLFFLVLTFLYPLILPYNYGSFIDNISLITAESLTKISPLYYLLDFILITFSIFLVKMVVTKKQSVGLLVFFLIFYSVENTMKYSAITLSEELNSSETLPISEKSQNVLLFILDSVSPSFMTDSLEKFWSEEEKEWVKDFTYYDNTTAISAGSTIGGFPTLIGGYKFSYQEHINTIMSNNINIRNIDRSRFKYFEDPKYFFSEQAMQLLQKEVEGKADVSYSYSYLTSSKEVVSSFDLVSPILSVSLYKFIPYFMKKLFAEGTQWKHYFSYKFFKLNRISGTIKKEFSEKGFVHVFHNNGTHQPIFPAEGYSTFSENPDLAVSQQLSRSVQIIRSVIANLKKLDLYDNTKIIVASDHGLYTDSKDFLKNRSPKGLEPFYTKNSPLIAMIPSLLMVKDFNTVNDKMKTDSRFLSLADISGMMKIPFLSDSLDYTKQNPPNRIFNIPLIDWRALTYLMGDIQEQQKKSYEKYVVNGQIITVHVESINKGVFTTNSHSLSNIIDLPAYTVIP